MENHRIFYFDNQPPGNFWGIKNDVEVALIPRLHDKVHILTIAHFVGITSADRREIVDFSLRVKNEIYRITKLTASVGIAYSKTYAKLASIFGNQTG